MILDLKVNISIPIIFLDNKSLLQIALNEKQTDLDKHTQIKYLNFKEAAQNKTITFKWIGTNQNIADLFTKPLAFNKFKDFIDHIENFPVYIQTILLD